MQVTRDLISSSIETDYLEGRDNYFKDIWIQSLETNVLDVDTLQVNQLITTGFQANTMELDRILGANSTLCQTITATGMSTVDFFMQEINAQSTTIDNINTTDFNGIDVECKTLTTPTITANSITSSVFNTEDLETVDFEAISTDYYPTGATGTTLARFQNFINGKEVQGSYSVVNNTVSQFSDFQLAEGREGPNTFFIYGTVLDEETSLPIICSFNGQIDKFDNQTGFGGTGTYFSMYSTGSGRTLRYDRDGNLKIYTDPNTIFWQTTHMVSDARAKENIGTLEPSAALDQIKTINGVYFNYKDAPNAPRSVGCLAQEVERVIPEAIIKPAVPEPTLSLDYEKLVPAAFGALGKIYDDLKEIINEQLYFSDHRL